MRLVFFIFMFMGLIFLTIGWYILKSKRIELLSQYNKKMEYNRDDLAGFAGKNLAFLGVLVILQNTIFLGISYIWVAETVQFISSAGFIITVLYFSLKVAFGVKKFEISERRSK